MPYVATRGDGTNISQFPFSSPEGHQEDQDSKRSRNHVNEPELSTNRFEDANGVNWKRRSGPKLSGRLPLTQSDEPQRSPDDVDWISLSLCQLTYLRTTLQTARNANHVRRVELNSIGVALDSIRSQIHCNDEPKLISTKVSPTPRISPLITSPIHLSIAPAGLATARVSDGRTTQISGLQFPAPPRSSSIQSPMTVTSCFPTLKSQDVGRLQSLLSPSVHHSSVAREKTPTDPNLNHSYRSLPRSPAHQHKKLDSINSDTLFDFSSRQSADSDLSIFYQQSLKREIDNSTSSDTELLSAPLMTSPLPIHYSPINHYQDNIEMEWDKIEEDITHIRPSARWPRFSKLRSLSDKIRVVSRQKRPTQTRSLPQMLSHV
ncbi:uncharacterized protein MELLADRAFT_71247 [Melampsora larici-populina 98AG31]|uniref:Uncharacterized protein n=1 Tax=Melampsora larici-populina (strain 98AG31 / pathotype 3-4-7) TaxID=747676 RepID=F4RE03_MELLP|nr:uncharacterized protein MELLADRAFT_71247 [Melampsora larici-populina 98AG31]EGG09496.1 hypothetical protein MELLADRAFT_71247 [Melampsora larici-populina 98AG31]